MTPCGTADLPLHGGRVPVWLTQRMTQLGAAIVVQIVIPAAILVAFGLAVFPAAYAVPRHDSLRNKQAPPLARTGLDNQPVDLAALRGRVVLLNFWATWCAPCQVEMPRFIAWQSKYKADGLSIIGVSMDDDAAPVASFVRQRRLNYPIVIGDEKLGLAYGGVLGLPVTYLIDRQGIIRARFQGESHLDAMETAFRKLLRSP